MVVVVVALGSTIAAGRHLTVLLILPLLLLPVLAAVVLVRCRTHSQPMRRSPRRLWQLQQKRLRRHAPHAPPEWKAAGSLQMQALAVAAMAVAAM